MKTPINADWAKATLRAISALDDAPLAASPPVPRAQRAGPLVRHIFVVHSAAAQRCWHDFEFGGGAQKFSPLRKLLLVGAMEVAPRILVNALTSMVPLRTWKNASFRVDPAPSNTWTLETGRKSADLARSTMALALRGVAQERPS